MTAFVRLGTAVSIAILIALAISWVGELDRSIVAPSGAPAVVYSEHRVRTISEETIVDELSALSLAADIRRVTLRSSMLQIDLEVREGSADPDDVLADVGELAKLALAESGNIARVFIRVLESGDRGGGETLLLALAGAKTEFREAELQRLRDGEALPASWLDGKMRLTVTDRWREWQAQR
ncbi:hypothetical protein [Paenibacillus sp.]|uniref:hypothetical protein n=1 Tax=Paenibacillus sp. TaxID=58172 RepID=UPI002D562ACF|nr:hypothetical protein [Paenibacillus sp.]HZG85237.1 hypothetical protein [Paenibacillus sp.]